jgi:hypothetical protein
MIGCLEVLPIEKDAIDHDRKKKKKVDLDNFFNFLDEGKPVAGETFKKIEKPLDGKHLAFLHERLK